MSRGLQLHINLAAIRQNYNILKNAAGNARIGAAVKADAYGLGMDRLAPLFHALGCRDFFVARMGEARALKNILPDNAEIYIFDGLTSAEDVEVCRKNHFIPVINSIAQAEIAGDLPVALHIDTGMNRLGLSLSDIETVKDMRLNLKLILTHAASADDPASPQTAAQFEDFKNIRTQFPGIPASFANSAAALSNPEWQLDMIRPGVALYGGASLPHGRTGIKDAVSLSAPILQIRQINVGETVGYGASFKAKQQMIVATIGIGYADGFFRSLSNQGYVYIQDTKCPIVGRVSMDLITVDISACTPCPAPGDMAEIIGPHIPLEVFAENAGTIGYEVLTRLGKSMEKCYAETLQINGE